MASARVGAIGGQSISATEILPFPPADGHKCPWAHITASPPRELNLNEIMSEQLADSLQVQEEAKYLKEVVGGLSSDEEDFVLPTELDLSDLMSQNTTDCGSDELIAQMLQMQYNKEYDSNLKKVEQKYNGASKVSVSLSNYMVSPTQPDSDSEDDEEQLAPKSKPWDSFEAHERAFPAMSSRGYVKVNNELVTKHDVTMSGRRNACRVMESFPPCIHTGDGASFDMQLSNKVYNNLKVYSKAEENRRTRVHDKIDRSTADMAVDAKTKLMLYKLINNSVLNKVYGIVATGKESIVMYGTGGGTFETEKGKKVEVPEECALKIFKTSLNEFKTRDKYIRDDYRFKDRFSKQNPQKVIHMWAEKEMHNLTRMSKFGIPCPRVIMLKKHILILEFIGKDMKPAPKLKDVKFPQDDDNALLISAYHQTIDGMTNLYKRSHLIHGDLSEYNILWHENKCYFIDVSQSVEPAHPNALEFLYRDCVNVCTFFGKRHLDKIHSPESLFTEICGFELKDDNGPAVLDKIRSFEKNVEQLTFAGSDKSYPFEYVWDEEHDED